MSATSRLIMLEFNELCIPIVRELMQQGQLPNFLRLYERSTVFTTEAGESPPNLEPWIQWPTVHSGMTYAQHGVFELGDGSNLREKCVADLLSDSGIPVGICGSMNVNYPQLNGYFIPDPWHKSQKTTPPYLQPFFDVVAKQVQESSRDDGLTARDAAKLGWFLLTHGLSPGTAVRAARQLLDERRDSGVRWRRASLLDHLQYDVFRHANRKHAVRFATFFCNSTAHYQHYYWRNMDPAAFTVAPAPDDHESLADAIHFGYRSMDALIGRALADYPDAVIVLCTALSQKAWTDTTKCTWRPKDFDALFAFAGVDLGSVTVQPVMAEQFHLEFTSATARERAEAALRALRVGNNELLMVRRETDRTLFCGCAVIDSSPPAESISRSSDRSVKPFRDLFYMIHTVRSGHHNAEGLFWFGAGRHEVVEQRIPIVDIAPTLLHHFGVSQPAYMHGRALPVRSASPAQPIARPGERAATLQY